MIEMELSGQVGSGELWEEGIRIFRDKLKADEGGDLSAVEQFLTDNSTLNQALETCELAKKQAGSKYSVRMTRILKKMQMFAQFGDIAIQHHPDTTALVWAAFRMMLQVRTALPFWFKPLLKNKDSSKRMGGSIDLIEMGFIGSRP